MKKITFLAALFMVAISYGQFTSSIFVLKSKKHDAPAVCTSVGGVGNTVDLSTLTYDLLDTETFKYFTIMAKTNDNISDGVVSTIDDIIKYSSGSTDLVVVSAQTKDTAFPTETGCGATFTGAKEIRMVLQYTPASYVAGTAISTVFELVGGDLITFNLNVTAAPLSVDDLEKFNFSYAPNPTKDFIRLSAANNIENVKVFNLLGQKMLSKEIASNKETVDISSLTNGIYVMKVSIGDSQGTFRIIKE